jgi:hypothetical protein
MEAISRLFTLQNLIIIAKNTHSQFNSLRKQLSNTYFSKIGEVLQANPIMPISRFTIKPMIKTPILSMWAQLVSPFLARDLYTLWRLLWIQQTICMRCILRRQSSLINSRLSSLDLGGLWVNSLLSHQTQIMPTIILNAFPVWFLTLKFTMFQKCSLGTVHQTLRRAKTSLVFTLRFRTPSITSTAFKAQMLVPQKSNSLQWWGPKKQTTFCSGSKTKWVERLV